MDKHFIDTVCSQCKNKSENCMLIRKKKIGSCRVIKCVNYSPTIHKKTGEDKIARYFLYKVLRTYYAENQKKFPENYFMS